MGHSTQRQTGAEGRRYEDPGRRRPRDWSEASTSQGAPRTASHWQKPEEVRGVLPRGRQEDPAVPLQEGHERPCPAGTWVWAPGPRTVRRYVAVGLSHLVIGILS